MYSDKHSGNQIINVRAKLDLAKNVKVEFSDMIEVSLDCSTCVAKRRTVIAYENKEKGFCVKRKHNFAAKVLAKNVAVEGKVAEVIYQLEYWYVPFYDRKQNKESTIFPSWGRIHFTVECFSCGKKIENSTQTNLVRPYTKVCQCGAEIYREREVMPLFEKVKV